MSHFHKATSVGDWFDQRLATKKFWNVMAAHYWIPKNINFLWAMGVILLVLFSMLFVSGLMLVMYYKRVKIMGKPIGWGKCNIIVKDLDTENSKWTKLGTPKENTTKLTPTKGDKKEAPIEGGENEAVKYSANKYVLEYVLRRLAGRKKPFKDVNGVISHRFAVLST